MSSHKMPLAVVSSRVGRIGKSTKTVSRDWDIYNHISYISIEMDGVDLAFYKNRALYHTKFDSLTYAEGGRRSLQAMIEAVRYGGLKMLDASATSREGRKDPIYFDGSSGLASILCSTSNSNQILVFGRYNYIWEMNTVFVVNVVFLVVFPVLLISCWVIYLFVANGGGAGGRFGK